MDFLYNSSTDQNATLALFHFCQVHIFWCNKPYIRRKLYLFRLQRDTFLSVPLCHKIYISLSCNQTNKLEAIIADIFINFFLCSALNCKSARLCDFFKKVCSIVFSYEKICLSALFVLSYDFSVHHFSLPHLSSLWAFLTL